jgi:hypothetical protein
MARNSSHTLAANELPSKNERKVMHLLLFSPLLAFSDPGVANSGAAFIVILYVAALVRSCKP